MCLRKEIERLGIPLYKNLANKRSNRLLFIYTRAGVYYKQYHRPKGNVHSKLKFPLYADDIFPDSLRLSKKKKGREKTKFLEYPWNQLQRVTISRSSCRIDLQQNVLRFCLKNRTILEKRFSLNCTLSEEFRNFIPRIFPLLSISQFHFDALCFIFHSCVLRSTFQAESTPLPSLEQRNARYRKLCA